MEKNPKRQFRNMEPETKEKISTTLTGRRKTAQHAQHISQGLKDYWKNVPAKPDDQALSPTASGKVI